MSATSFRNAETKNERSRKRSGQFSEEPGVKISVGGKSTQLQGAHHCDVSGCGEISIQPTLFDKKHSPILIRSSSPELKDMASNGVVAIDLTADSDKEEDTVVDLTSPVQNEPRKKRKRNSQGGAARTRDQPRVVSQLDDSDVIILSSSPPAHRPSVNLMSPPNRPNPPLDSPVHPHLRSPPPSLHPPPPPRHPSPVHHTPTPPSLESPGSNGISCPICMDSKRLFTEAGRTLVATKCGHLFCDACIQQSIKLNHKCPTCSTRLTLRQYHRIYL